MRTAFLAAWLGGAAALVAGAFWGPARIALAPAGAVLVAAGIWGLGRASAGGLGTRLARAWGVDMERTTRGAAWLVIVLGVAWLLAGVLEAAR